MCQDVVNDIMCENSETRQHSCTKVPRQKKEDTELPSAHLQRASIQYSVFEPFLMYTPVSQLWLHICKLKLLLLLIHLCNRTCAIQCCQVAREGRDGVNGVRNVRLWRRKEDFQAPARCNTLPCILAIHYHVLLQYTTMYSRNTQPCVIAIHYNVPSKYTPMYSRSTFVY